MASTEGEERWACRACSEAHRVIRPGTPQPCSDKGQSEGHAREAQAQAHNTTAIFDTPPCATVPHSAPPVPLPSTPNQPSRRQSVWSRCPYLEPAPARARSGWGSDFQRDSAGPRPDQDSHASLPLASRDAAMTPRSGEIRPASGNLAGQQGDDACLMSPESR